MKNNRVLFPSLIAAILLSASRFGARPHLFAQAPAPQHAPKLAFDVATIRPSPPPDREKMRADMEAGKMPRIGPHVTASRAEYINMTLKDLVALAWNLRGYQVSGPDWLGGERFDIEAAMPEGARKDDAPAMLRALLQERFKLAAHESMEEHKVLALLVAKSGPRLKESKTAPQPVDENAPLKPNEILMDGPDGPVRMSRNPDGSMIFDLGRRGTIVTKLDLGNQALRIESDMVTMGGFTDTLSVLLGQMGGQQVVDQTGLKGNYELAVEISFADLMSMAQSQGLGPPPPPAGSANGVPAASDPTGGSSMFQSVKQLGLELAERNATVKRLVIDHIEKMPAEN
jgi:uncharacterized protein (TIGR03435 family)